MWTVRQYAWTIAPRVSFDDSLTSEYESSGSMYGTPSMSMRVIVPHVPFQMSSTGKFFVHITRSPTLNATPCSCGLTMSCTVELIDFTVHGAGSSPSPLRGDRMMSWSKSTSPDLTRASIHSWICSGPWNLRTSNFSAPVSALCGTIPLRIMFADENTASLLRWKVSSVVTTLFIASIASWKGEPTPTGWSCAWSPTRTSRSGSRFVIS